MTKRDVPSPNENMAPSNDQNDAVGTPVAKKARIVSNERVTVAGRVASVKLQNFMCHANLLIEFNTRINNCFYIGGPNGSGKSALFAAINLGLGGRGSDNDRGNTVKSYIKDGTTQAKITITLTNGGLNAHPDFDDFISVERTINQTSSTYVLKSIRVSPSGHCTEKLISKKKGDIDRIISRFNIHLSNPAFWMSQDRSRSFLSNFKPSNVYKLYLESTNLEKILLSYMRFADMLEECRRVVNSKSDDLKDQSDKIKRMQEQQKLNEKLEADRIAISAYTWKLLFCKIRDCEDAIAVNDKKMELHKKLHAQIKAEYQQNRIERSAVEEKAQELADNVEVLKMEIDEYNAQLDEINKENSKFDQRAKDINQDIKLKKYEVKAAKEEISKAQKQVREILEKQGCDELTKQLTKTEDLYNKVSQEREEMETGGEAQRLKDRCELIEADLKQKDDEKYEVQGKVNQLRRAIEKNTDVLKRSKAMKQDTINKFGSRMAEILFEIGKCKSQFDHVPKGPLGKFIALKDQKWAYPVEECLSNLSNQFLCTSPRDATTLRKVFDRLRIHPNERPTVIVSRFLGHAHTGLQEPSAEFDTIYRNLTFSDPDVHNAIVDKTSCESILLINEKMEAMNVMREHPPRNAIKAYTLDGSQAYAGGSSGQYRFYAGQGGKASGLFGNEQENVDEVALTHEIELAKSEMQRLETNDLREYEVLVRDLRAEHYKAKSAIDEFEKTLAHLRSQELNAERKMKDLRKKVTDSANEEMLESLNDGIEEMKNKVPEIEQKIKELQMSLEAVKAENRPVLEKRALQEKHIEEARQENKEFVKQTKSLQKQLAEFDQKGDLFKSRLDKLNADQTVMFHDEARLKSEKDEAEAYVQNEKLNVPMPQGETDPPDLSDFPATQVARQKLIDLTRAVQRTAVSCDTTITLDSIKDLKEQLKKYRYYCRMCHNVIDNLQDVHEGRLSCYPTLKKFTELQVCDKFQELLAVRGHFIGGLEFDHDKQTLNVNVQSCKDKDAMASSQQVEEEEAEEDFSEEDDESDDDGPRRKKAKKQPGKKKKKNRDLKGLSGGERSFVTAALVMSLWEVMEQPFRMMDEFDVFMDMMNRKLVMDLLVELATKKFPHNQFIFFTPQGIKELKIVDGLQVFEMNKVRD